MARTTFLIIGLLLLTACGGGSSGAQNSNDAEPTDAIASLPDSIEQYLSSQVDPQSPGVSLLVRKDGNFIYSGARGVARTVPAQAIVPATGFRLASISKPFTALAIMQLVQSGAISVHEHVINWLPELSDTYQDVTLHQLLTHTSGILDFVNDNNDLQQLDGWRNPDVVARFLNGRPLEFAPGSQTQYSNTGYVLLAMVVERVTGINFADYMATEVFIPANMSGSYVIDGQFPVSTTEALNYAQSAEIFGFTSLTNGSSSQVSSVQDIDAFISTFRAGDYLNQDTIKLMLTCHTQFPGGSHYGYGWELQCDADGNVLTFSHTGSWDGFQGILFVDLQRDLEVTILSNGGAVTRQHQFALFELIIDFYR